MTEYCPRCKQPVQKTKVRQPFRHVQSIITASCQFYGLTRDLVLGSDRRKQVAHARHMAIYIARETTGASYPELGFVFNQDHTTVRSAHLRMQQRLALDTTLKDHVESIRKATRELLAEPRFRVAV